MTFSFWTRMLAFAAMLACLAAGCSRRTDDHEHHAGCNHDHDHNHEAHEASDDHDECCDHDHDDHDDADETHQPQISVFEIPENAQRLLGLTFVTAEARRLTGTVRFPGRFEWMPGARRIYGTAVPGAVELRVRPPQRVKAGDVLFTVRSPEWIAKKGEAREAEAALALVKAEADALRKRLDQLREAGVRNAELEQQFTTKEAEAVRAERTRQNAEEAQRAVLSLCREKDGQLIFEAREDGAVERVSVENGAWAEVGAEVVCVAKADGLWFRADGSPAEMLRVQTGQRGFVEPLSKERGDAAAGKIELGFVADSAARIHPIYLLADALPAWAAPGRAGVLNVLVEESAPESVAVPRTCVVMDGLQSVVFVRDAQDAGRFLKVEVEPGATDGEWVEAKGLVAGMAVVQDGAYELKLAFSSSGGQKKATGHFHADGQFHEGEH